MGRDVRIPCLECEHKFTNDTPAGKVKCPNCYTEYRLRRDPISGEERLDPYTPVSSVSLSKTPDMVRGKTDEATKKETLYLLSLLPRDGECNFCRKPLTFANTVKVKIKTGRVYVDKFSTDFVQYKDGGSEVFHNQERVPLPESVAIKTKNVNVCSDCVSNPSIVRVLPDEVNKTTDRWAKKTGARRQHFSRQVDERTAHEAKADGMHIRTPDRPDRTIMRSGQYFERIVVSKKEEEEK